MSRQRKAPTAESIRRQVTRLLHDMAAVYSEPVRLEKTNEHGTIVVEWRDGLAVLEEKDRV